MSQKCRKFEKNQLRSDNDIFFGKIHKFWSLESRSQSFWRSVGVEVLTRSRTRRLQSWQHHWYPV